MTVARCFCIGNSSETHQLHVVYFQRVMCHVSTDFQFIRRNNDISFIFFVSLVRLYRFSTFNFQF